MENEVNALLWQNDVGDMLVEMMEMAGYTLQSQRMHMDFFTCNVAPALGSHPAVYPSSQGWRSFMADDYSPIELRWSWSQTNAIPTIRYSIEPIGKWAGLYGDYFNTRTSVELVHKFQRSYHGVNLAWYEHFFRELVVSREEDFGRKLFDENDYKSQIFLGFDLKMQKSMLKVYFLPAFKAAATGESKLTIVERAISALPYGGHSLSNAFSHVSQYVHSFQPAHRPEVEILAIDSADPLFSRLKIYFRSRETSFDSVISMMTLGGRLKQVSKNGLARLEELWRLLLMLDYNVPTSEPLRHNDHRTAGILYYFELRIGHPFPKPKLYIPVKHYGMNDFEVARGLSTYLTSKGKQLIGDDYCNNVQRLWYVIIYIRSNPSN